MKVANPSYDDGDAVRVYKATHLDAIRWPSTERQSHTHAEA